MKHSIFKFPWIIGVTVLLLAACSAPGGSVTSVATVPITNPPTQPAPTTSSLPAAATQLVPPTPGQTQPIVGETAIPAQPTENALAPETNPVGDIPDSQVFITYTSATGGYSLEVPEGWARTEQDANVRFVDKFDGVCVKLTTAAAAPTLASVPQNEAAALAQSERAFQPGQISAVNLPGGQAVRITATANSDPGPVTGKQVRVEEEFYLFYQNGKLATLKLWAPQGADNVDQWKRMSESFRWK